MGGRNHPKHAQHSTPISLHLQKPTQWITVDQKPTAHAHKPCSLCCQFAKRWLFWKLGFPIKESNLPQQRCHQWLVWDPLSTVSWNVRWQLWCVAHSSNILCTFFWEKWKTPSKTLKCARSCSIFRKPPFLSNQHAHSQPNHSPHTPSAPHPSMACRLDSKWMIVAFKYECIDNEWEQSPENKKVPCVPDILAHPFPTSFTSQDGCPSIQQNMVQTCPTITPKLFTHIPMTFFPIIFPVPV